MDQLAAMRAFVSVVDTGSFTRASAQIGIPKATMTKLVQALEAHLRTKLLNRTTRRVLVTVDGALYYERAARLLSEIEELDGTMANAQALPQGKLRIEMSGVLATQIVVPALRDFHSRYPDIAIDLGVSDRQIDILAENVDCAIRIGALDDQSLVARRVGQMHLVTCAAPRYLALYGAPAHPKDLENGHRVVRFFRPAGGQPVPFVFRRSSETFEVLGEAMISVDDALTYLVAAEAGHGVVQAPRFVVQAALREGRLQPVLSDWSRDPMPIHIVYPPNRHVSNKLRVFVDWVAGVFSTADL
ncbi:LysR family transcriptional regulator [Thioclava sp. BHET1]|nr:LysR family transcriptional regulator [Thioclava sp. BHET1]